MKIKNKPLSYEEVLVLQREKHQPPRRPAMFWRWLLKTVSASDLKATDFSLETEGMDRLASDEPAVFLMNHSSFIDLKIASTILYPRPFNIICTSDGFVGKDGLMRSIGCVPTQKFVSDVTLVRDILYAVNKLGDSILMYPEASYTFDGTATPLPESVGKLLKKLKVPVVMIKTSGAFLRDPLYNMLQLRNVKVSAKMSYVFSPEDLKEKSAEEINEVLKRLFSFDNFRDQQEMGVVVDEPFRADGLNRVLYKCPVCSTEGEMLGKGITLSCGHCGSSWELTETGFLKKLREEGADTVAAVDPAGDPVDSAGAPGLSFTHIPDWYAWERAEVRKELESGEYRLDIPVLIRMLVDTKSLYTVGEGRLVHTAEGFHLTGCGGKLDYSQDPSDSYSLYSDYYWYELGDMICIGDSKTLYYCFPQEGGDVVAKTRLAAEELFKLKRKDLQG